MELYKYVMCLFISLFFTDFEINDLPYVVVAVSAIDKNSGKIRPIFNEVPLDEFEFTANLTNLKVRFI